MRLRWTEMAGRDLTQICDYIEERDSAATARRVALAIVERLANLTEFPESGRIGRKPGTRELIFAGLPYFAVYRLREETIEVLRILHGARDWR